MVRELSFFCATVLAQKRCFRAPDGVKRLSRQGGELRVAHDKETLQEHGAVLENAWLQAKAFSAASLREF